MGQTRPKRSFLLFVEGRVTEDLYLTHWARELRDHIRVEIDPLRGVPLSLVQAAVAAKQAAERAQKRGQGAAGDEIWCVFDRDEHPNIPQALDLAARHGISIAYSNPCIELWFILHAQDQHAALDRHEAARQSERVMGFDKRPSPGHLSFLVATIDEAIRRADRLDLKHQADGSPPHANPSSTLGRLIDSMRGRRLEP